MYTLDVSASMIEYEVANANIVSLLVCLRAVAKFKSDDCHCEKSVAENFLWGSSVDFQVHILL